MRLDHYISRETGRSRREAGQAVRRGRVAVDGEVVRRPAQHVRPGESAVSLDGEPVAWLGEVTLMLHKPEGVLSATHDASQPTVIDLVPSEWLRPGLAPVGRLDKDTTGLLLLTTDGELNHHLTHPRRHVEKRYRARFEGVLDAGAAERFRGGMTLRDGTETAPATLEVVAPGEAVVVLTEGRYHQVKRMLAACGARVTALHREAVGPLALDPDLPPGRCRLLTDAEVETLRS